MQSIAPDTVIDERYRVLRRIGSGGMADVYCAEDLQLGRHVALKLLYRRLAEDAEFVERFRREASSAAGLQHPNVVQVYDRGEWDGTYYIAMELLEGRSLKQVVREEGPLDPARAADYVIGVLKALRFAHKRGIVHRDIKPHNVIVDSTGHVKVTDFGIARAGASDMTETGSIMGTAQYLSPEQAQGHPVDARSDLYSAGVLLYELLTGRVPFEAESAVTIALKHVSEAPMAPSHLNLAVSGPLEDVVIRALAKDPAMRFQDSDEFIAALGRVRDIARRPEDATRVAPATGVYPALTSEDPYAVLEEADRRNGRWWLWLLALLLLAAGAAGAYLLLVPEKKAVPDVVGLRGDTAAQKLQNAGFEVDIQSVESATAPRNDVIAQNPSAGEDAKVGSIVTIRVSAGPGEAPIPDVAGDPRRTAEKRLRDAGFRVTVREQFSDEVGKNRVIETSPPARTLYERDRAVQIVVSRGPEQIEVPDVVGLQRLAAETAIEERQLRAVEREEESDTAAPGEVLRQDPAAGTQVDKGSAVTLVIAIEPAEVAVPDVVDLPLDRAIAALEDAGFRVRRERQQVDTPDQDEIVLSQTPLPGQPAPRGSRVVIAVGEFSPDLNPDPTPTPEVTVTP
jgi:serine/threonine-protein kinase